MIFGCSLAGGTGSFVAVAGAEAAESVISQHVDCFQVGDTEGFAAVDVGDSVAEGFAWSGAEGFGGTFLADYVDCLSQSSYPCSSSFLQMGQVVPMSIFLWLVWTLSGHEGLLQFWVIFLF